MFTEDEYQQAAQLLANWPGTPAARRNFKEQVFTRMYSPQSTAREFIIDAGDMSPETFRALYGIKTEGQHMKKSEMEQALVALSAQIANIQSKLSEFGKFPDEVEWPNIVRFVAKTRCPRRKIPTLREWSDDLVGKTATFSNGTLSIDGVVVSEGEPEERELVYVAARINDKWYLTGTIQRAPMTHEEFEQWLLDHKVTQLEFFADPSDVRELN